MIVSLIVGYLACIMLAFFIMKQKVSRLVRLPLAP